MATDRRPLGQRPAIDVGYTTGRIRSSTNTGNGGEKLIMSTRATIAYETSDGGYRAIYLHFDGYPEHAGTILEEHYTSMDSISSLVTGGDLRSLDRDGTPERFANGDRSQILPTRVSLHEFAKNCDSEFVYVFQDGAWHCHKM